MNFHCPLFYSGYFFVGGAHSSITQKNEFDIIYFLRCVTIADNFIGCSFGYW